MLPESSQETVQCFRETPRVLAVSGDVSSSDNAGVIRFRFGLSPVSEGAGSDIRFAAPTIGTAVVTTDSFHRAVADLDATLFAAMADRIAELERIGPPSGVRLDFGALRTEHADRATWLRRCLDRERDVDWEAVRVGSRQLLS